MDPFALKKLLWPQVTFYREQRRIIQSVWENDQTLVSAGNMLGKDYVAAFIALAFFLTRHPCRILTTSVDYKQLSVVLWGEIGNWIRTSKYPLDCKRGGPLLINHLHIRKMIEVENGKPGEKEICPLSYLIGRVAAKGEGMLGHHIADRGDGIPRTLFLVDESSGVDDLSRERASTWHRRLLEIGNPFPCNNGFKRGVLEGSIPRPNGVGFTRNVIKIRAEDSPNVRIAMAYLRAGKDPFTAPQVLPGVLPYADYVTRRRDWDIVRQTVSLDAEFYQGSDVLLYPPDWINRAHEADRRLRQKRVRRQAKAIGIDPGEGGDKTAMAAVDELGIIELVSKKTPNTAAITGEAIAFMRKHNVPPTGVCIDRGGGGKQHADRLRDQGFNVRTVAFGESVMMEPKRGMRMLEEQRENREDRYTYVNRRAQMYGEFSDLLDPSRRDEDGKRGEGFGIPEGRGPGPGDPFTELRNQMAIIPKTFDSEGRLRLLPKNRPNDAYTGKTLVDLIGHSPDELDAVVLAVHGMLHPVTPVVVGAIL